MSLLDVDIDTFDVPGREAWCARCGHWYGAHLFGGCAELIPCAGLAFECSCAGFVSVADALVLDGPRPVIVRGLDLEDAT